VPSAMRDAEKPVPTQTVQNQMFEERPKGIKVDLILKYLGTSPRAGLWNATFSLALRPMGIASVSV
jgi:hypothetical protein